MGKRTVVSLERRGSRVLSPPFHEDDVRSSESLVEHFLGEYTDPGQLVLDPFAGYGTTLEVAERMGRVGFGIELDPARVEYAQSFLEAPERMIHGDSRRLHELELPKFHFSLTSPPYRSRFHHPEDPLSAYAETGGSYGSYLRGVREVFRGMKAVLLPSATVVVEVSNLKTPNHVTPLAWDVGAELSSVLDFVGETIVVWDTPCFGYDHTYCLVFENHP